MVSFDAAGAGYTGPDLLQMSVNDTGDNLSGSAAVSITVNAPPSIAAPATASLNENASWTFSGTISLTDAAAGSSSDSMALSVAHGTLTLATTSGLTFTAGANGGASFVVTGSVANLNAALNGLTYRPTANYAGSDLLAISISDPGDKQSASTSVALTVRNPPAITAPATATVVVTSTLTFSTANKNAVSITDVSAGNAVEPLTLTAIDGTLTLGSTTGITFSSGTNNSASMTINGTLANLNAALSGLTFTPAKIGTGTVVLSYTDLGNGLLASATINITVSKGVTKLGRLSRESAAIPHGRAWGFPRRSERQRRDPRIECGGSIEQFHAPRRGNHSMGGRDGGGCRAERIVECAGSAPSPVRFDANGGVPPVARRFHWHWMTPSVTMCPSQGLGLPFDILPLGWIELF